MKIFHFAENLLDRLCVVLGAFVGSQIPEFMQQYTQRLAGHVDELNHLLDQLRQVATYSNKTLEQYIEKFISNADLDFSRQGEFMQGVVNRWQELHQALNHLMQSSIWSRPYIFIKDLQYDIAQSTLTSFQPGINLSAEGLCYTGAGILISLALYHTLTKCLAIGYSRTLGILNTTFNKSFQAISTFNSHTTVR